MFGNSGCTMGPWAVPWAASILGGMGIAKPHTSSGISRHVGDRTRFTRAMEDADRSHNAGNQK